jgi:hypothetical protein
MNNHPWSLMAACRNPQCKQGFQVVYEGSPQVFWTKDEAIAALKEAAMKDYLRLGFTVEGAIGDMTPLKPRKQEVPLRILECPSCGRLSIYPADRLFVEKREDFTVSTQ